MARLNQYLRLPHLALALSLIIPSYAVSRWRNDDVQELGTMAPEFYRAGLKYMNHDYNSATWKLMVAEGKVPYHKLRGADYQVRNELPENAKVYTYGFTNYQFKVTFVQLSRSSVKAAISKLDVYSGFDVNKSGRLASMTDPSVYLSHEQGHLDLNELTSRTFAGLVASSSPEGFGSTRELANADLAEKLTAIYLKVSRENRKEQNRFDKDTESGLSQAGQMTATADLTTRLKRAEVQPTWTTTSSGSSQTGTLSISF